MDLEDTNNLPMVQEASQDLSIRDMEDRCNKITVDRKDHNSHMLHQCKMSIHSKFSKSNNGLIK